MPSFLSVQVMALPVMLLTTISLLLSVTVSVQGSLRCRTQPGDPTFPNKAVLSTFNRSIDGRLLTVVPSGEFCQQRPGGCPDVLWFDGNFRGDIPGALLNVNWEQDYDSNPPSLCFRNTTVCGQGNVPVLGINATTAAHIQAGVNFARIHNLRVSVKASGHDLLGRATAKGSLLLWTRHLQNVTFHDSFKVAGINHGSAVTVGSGVGLHDLYALAKARGKIFVGGTAASVASSGGYVQGAGHSQLSPTLGLAADTVFQFEVVTADGRLLTVNSVSHHDLFWALRGGGAGSWGVLVSTTFQTFPTFDAVVQTTTIIVNTTEQVAQLTTLHAQHIFDLDPLLPGQSSMWIVTPPTFTWSISTIFPNASITSATAALAPFMDGVNSLGFTPVASGTIVQNINDVLGAAMTDSGGLLGVIGSRLWPPQAYRSNATAIGNAYKELLDTGVPIISGNLVAGGQVSKNAHIDSAVTPKWRTAKTHIIIAAVWTETTTPAEVEAIREDMTNNKVPILAAVAGPNSGSYSNEADVREPHFQTTFFGPNYGRLSIIKNKYDPKGMFIVGAGVGSEHWDIDGICQLS